MQLGGENGKIGNSQGAPLRSEPGEAVDWNHCLWRPVAPCALAGEAAKRLVQTIKLTKTLILFRVSLECDCTADAITQMVFEIVIRLPLIPNIKRITQLALFIRYDL